MKLDAHFSLFAYTINLIKKFGGLYTGLAILFAIVFAPFKAHSWSMAKYATTLEYLAKNADYICHIRVESLQTQRTNLTKDFNWIITWIYPEVIHCWKGDLSNETEFISLGGNLEGVEYTADGLFPLFHQAEASIVFLKMFPQGLAPLSHNFGKKTIEGQKIKETGESLSQFVDRLEGVLR